MSKFQVVDDVLQREFCIANSRIGAAVVDFDLLIFTEQAAAKHHVSKEAVIPKRVI